MRPLPAPFDDIAAGRPASIGVAGPALLGGPPPDQDLGFPEEDARRSACAASSPTAF